MKKIIALCFIAAIMLMNLRCSDNEDILITNNVAPYSTLDTVAVPDLSDSVKHIVDTEKKDSLSPKKYIYLTIDDAPINGSEYIDSVISHEKIKTNLFLVGKVIHGSGKFMKYYKKYKENPYIEIYNHSYCHANNRYVDFYKNPEAVLVDFEKNQADFNISHKIARLPGRNLWQIGDKKKNYNQTGATSADLLVENGYKVYGWDVEWKYDSKDYTPKQSIEELVKEIENLYHKSRTFVPNHVVLLMHNQMFAKMNGKNNLGELINRLKELNYTFEYLSAFPY